MGNFDEALAGLAADALGGRVGGDEIGVGGFEIFELLHQPVEIGVADFGIIENVVAVFVMADLVAKRLEFLLDVFIFVFISISICIFIFCSGGHRKDYRRNGGALAGGAGGVRYNPASSGMKKVRLIYNPASGGSRGRREHQVEAAVAVFRGAGIEAELTLPRSPAEAREQTRRAVDEGCDAVFACGGDGTIHNLIQVLANSPVALGILPMGTANALAHDLGLPMNVVKAAQAALNAKARRVALGKIKFSDLNGEMAARFFVVAAGVGVDAHLFYKLHSGTKQRMGMAAYYAKAWQLWFSHMMIRFEIEFSESGAQEKRRADVTELLAVRIRNFGGVLRELAPGASLERNDLRLVYCRTASRISYLHYVVRGLLGRRWRVKGIDLAHSERVKCSYRKPENEGGKQERVYVETDGELVGKLPAEISVEPDALTILGPG